ncbi:MAG: hypothetical protein Q8903_00360 [Bacteroidota bacterium]|nr:hypothetical protein [Bacteroidota bacterium]
MDEDFLVDEFQRAVEIGRRENQITVEEVRELISLITKIFRELLIANNFSARNILRLTTKFRDAGRRSAPWRPTSERVPGRPQDGADGNRILRWLLPTDHKFYATEINATLVEIKYYLQCLSMQNAPFIPNAEFRNAFIWLLGHQVEPGRYLDPIQLLPIDLNGVINDARSIQSGHYNPLDRGGRHIPSNTFLMLARSNQLQGNLTVEELLDVIRGIINRHSQINLH